MMRAVCAIGFVISAVALLAQNVVATPTYTVGGSTGWTVPTSNNKADYNQWAEKMRFQVGDSLLFVYNGNSDSVLQVSKADYDSCSTASSIKKYSDGHTVIKFDHSGPYYFISGNRDNCLKNEKLVVVVMADRTKKVGAPATAPTTSALGAPSPAPIGFFSPPSPPPSEETINPSAASPSPSTVPLSPPEDNGSSSLVNKGLVGSVGVLVGLASLVTF